MEKYFKKYIKNTNISNITKYVLNVETPNLNPNPNPTPPGVAKFLIICLSIINYSNS